MQMSQEQIEELRERIITVFPKVDPPLLEDITSHHCDECHEVRDDFHDVRWWAASTELIDENFDDLSLFTPEAYHYYLPAFLLRALDAFDPDSLVLQFCIYNLSPKETPIDDPWYRERLNQFYTEEASVISRFLEYIRDDERFHDLSVDADLGIRKFWQAALH
jgi:hypothetical protein